MVAQRTKNGLKITGALLMLALFLAVVLLGPALREDHVPPSSVQLPAMSNVPPPGSLQVEVEPGTAQSAESPAEKR